jgi:hypothetical protein
MEDFPQINEHRTGDEEADARIGDFKVYGGSPTDRMRLQAGDPELIDDLDAQLQDLLDGHHDETGSELP